MRRGPRLRPRWLRPTTVLVVVGLHLAGFTLARAVVAPLVPSSAPILEILSAPEPALASAEATPAPEVPPVEPPTAEPPPPEPVASPEPSPEAPEPAAVSEPVPEPVSEPVSEPVPEPMVEPTPDPVLASAEAMPAPPTPAVQPPEPRIVTVAPPPPKPPVPRKRRPKTPVERRTVERRQPSAPSADARAAAEAASTTGRAAAAAYAAQVAAEFARHKHYPAAARAAGVEGTCVLAFVIGPSGALASHAIVRSSGDTRLDAAVHAMAAASRFPPPPGGRFRSTVPVRFSLRR